MNAIALDDEPLALEVIKSHSAKVPFLELKAVFTDAFQAMEYLQKHPIDLLFLDIKMPDISGLEFLTTLSVKPMVIFTTAYSEHAVTSFELDAVDYLLKPFSLSRFIKGCNKANELFILRNKGGSDHIFIKTGYEQEKIRFADILFFEAAGNYVNVILKDTKLMTRMTFSELEALLPRDRFIRTHRSFIVAVNAINRIERHQLHLPGFTIPVSDTFSPALAGLK